MSSNEYRRIQELTNTRDSVVGGYCHCHLYILQKVLMQGNKARIHNRWKDIITNTQIMEPKLWNQSTASPFG